ncbi:MAG: hypothetical protein C0474_09830 [Sphingobium sp.]|jgi:hypothetical protein|nr:hypothetical protein [Sphingobium sp.]
MGMLDGLLAQLGPNLDIASMATKVGLSPEQAEMAVKALGMAHPEPGDTVASAASSTGLSPEILQQVVGMIGGEGALGSIAGMLGGAAAEGGAGGVLGQVTGMLDRDGDGNPLNDIASMAGGLFGGKN